MGYLVLTVVWISNLSIEVEVEGFFGGGNRVSNVLVVWRIWGVYGGE